MTTGRRMNITTPVARKYAIATAAGFGGGGCIGLVGWGGAQVLIPTLTHPQLGGLSQLAASATSICSLSCSAVMGGAQYLRSDHACLPIAAAIALPSMLGARAGVRLAGNLSGDAHALIFNGMSVVMIPTHFVVQRQRARARQDAPDERGARVARGLGRSGAAAGLTAAALAQHAAYGVFSGALSAVMGVGGLPLTMSYLSLATAEESFPHHLVQGTAMVAVVPSILASAGSHLAAGNVPVAVAACASVGAIAGASLGAQLGLSLSEDRLRELYMLSLLVLGGRSAIGAARNISRLYAKSRKAA